MPACTAESLTKLWTSNHREQVKASLENSDSNPSSPTSPSPITISPVAPFRRTRSAITSDFFQEPFVIKSEWRDSRCATPQPEEKSLLVRIIGWYPCFLLQVLQAAIAVFLPTACVRTLISLPALWVSAWFWAFWKIFDFPLAVFKWWFTMLCMPSMELFRKKRTVLISGGSSIQALHLARNFYSAGARVVVCEVEDYFSLTRFSTAVSKFYTLPKPSMENQRDYVKALCEIVEKERVVCYVPVNVTSPAIFDASAKPLLELMGCSCFCPTVKQVLVLDDISEVLHRCIDNGIPTPAYFPVKSKSKLIQLYQNGTLGSKKYVMNSCGNFGSVEKLKFVLPNNINDIKFPGEINESKPWIAIEDQPGQHFITCTTVKNSEVIANVTCKLDQNKCLVPMNYKEVDIWLQNFFTKLNVTKPISGHFTFKLVVTKDTILPINCKIGISLPYICHTSVHPKMLLKPCKHFNRQSSGPLVVNKGRYWMHHALLNAVQKPSVESLHRFIGTVLDKREMLFEYWDPLPYCAYYHIQLPFRNILRFLHHRRLPEFVTAPV